MPSKSSSSSRTGLFIFTGIAGLLFVLALISMVFVLPTTSVTGADLEAPLSGGTPFYIPQVWLDPTNTPTATPPGIPQIIAEIPFPQPGCAGAAEVNPLTGLLYVANNGNDTISIFNATQHISTMPTGVWPSHLSVDPNSSRAFLTNLRDANFSVYDNTNFVTNIDTTGESFDILYNPVHDTIYVSDLSGYVTIFDGQTYEMLVAHNFYSNWILGLGMDSATGRVYAANWAEGKVFILDGLQAVGAVQAGWGVENVAADPVTGYVYAAHSVPNSDYPQNVSVIKDDQLVFTATTGIRSMAVAVNPTTGLAYITNIDNDSVTVLFGDQWIGNMSVGARPSAVAVNPLTGYVFVTNQDDDTVTIIEAGTVVATAPPGPTRAARAATTRTARAPA